MARSLGVQPTYVTHILSGKANLSLEQAERLSAFFGHTKEEGQYFLLLVSHERAGTHTLKAHFQEQIDSLLAQRLVLTKRLGQINPLTEEQRSVFYSAWPYLAVQIALTIPKLQDHLKLASHLGLSTARVQEVLQFLIRVGLVVKKGTYFVPTSSQIRLGNDSHLIAKHHTHWRLKAIESLDREGPKDMHYSAVLSLSEKDMIKIKGLLLDQLKNNLKIVTESKEERLVGMNIDFYDLEMPR